MSSPIKPPGSPPGMPSPDSVGSVGAGESSKSAKSAQTSETFQQVLEEATAPHAAASALAPDDIAALAAEAAAGRLTAEEVVERLVSRALEGPTAAALPPAERAELEVHLRRALADDPTLAALTQGLSSGD